MTHVILFVVHLTRPFLFFFVRSESQGNSEYDKDENCIHPALVTHERPHTHVHSRFRFQADTLLCFATIDETRYIHDAEMIHF